MEFKLYNHFTIKDAHYVDENYMISPTPLEAAASAIIKPYYVPLVLPIATFDFKHKQYQLTQTFEELVTLQHHQFRRFYETVVTTVGFLAEQKLCLPALWSCKSFWTHNGYFYIPFSAVGGKCSAAMSLKHAFLLAMDLMFGINKLKFAELKKYITETAHATPLLNIYNAIGAFSGDYTELYRALTELAPAMIFHPKTTIELSGNPAEGLMQKCILRSVGLVR